MADNKPLWKVLQDAYYSVQPHPDVLSEDYERQTNAAEIRAIRDWLVPPIPATGPLANIGGIEIPEREAIRAVLTAEADKAEAGQ